MAVIVTWWASLSDQIKKNHQNTKKSLEPPKKCENSKAKHNMSKNEHHHLPPNKTKFYSQYK